MSEISGIPEPKSEPISPTEASKRWGADYSPSLKQVLAATVGGVIFLAGWSQGHADLETAKMAMEQGLFSEAALKGILGVAEAAAGVAGGVAGMGWAWKDHVGQLARNHKPK